MKYFAHDVFARQDIEIKKMIHKFGMAGYGIFWALAEILHDNDNRLDFEELEIIADDLKVKFDVIKSIIFDFNLFICEKNVIKSKRVAKNLKQQKEKSQKAKQSAKQRWQRKPDYANALPTHSERNAIKENKIKESKVKENKTNIDIFCNSDFQKVFTIYQENCKNLSPLLFEKRNKDVLQLLSDFLEETETDFEYFKSLCKKANTLEKIADLKIDFKMILKNHIGIMNGKYDKGNTLDLSKIDFS